MWNTLEHILDKSREISGNPVHSRASRDNRRRLQLAEISPYKGEATGRVRIWPIHKVMTDPFSEVTRD